MVSFNAPEGVAWEFAVLFLVMLIAPLLIERLRLPGIIGLLIGGYLIGPHALGVIPDQSSTVPNVGDLGLLYLMFVAGLELDLSVVRAHRHRVTGFAALTFSLPMTFGIVAGLLMDWSVPASVLLGCLLCSQTLLTYPIVRRAGLASSKATAAAVGATVVTDTLALITLAVVAGTQTGDGTGPQIVLQLAIGLAILLAATLWLLPKVTWVALRRFGTNGSVRYLIAITAFLLSAALADVVGIEGLVGAFFAGLALNRFVPNEGPLMDRVEFFGSTFFIPIFMVSVGLILNPAVMFTWETLGLALVMIVASLGGKAIAARLTVPLFGFSRDEAGLVFSLTSPQTAAVLATVIVGFRVGLFDETVVNAALVVILVSVVLSTLLAERSVKRIGPPETVNRPFGSHILVAVKYTEDAHTALGAAAWIAVPEGGTATIVTVEDPHHPGLSAEIREQLDREAVAAGLDAHFLSVHDKSFARGVLNAAATSGASMILAANGDGPARAADGWPEAVAEAAPIPTAILSGRIETLESVRVLVDHGCDAASELAEAIGLRVGTHVSRIPVYGQVFAGRPPVPAPGELLIRPIRGWEVLAGMPDVPAGAGLLAIPEFLRPEWLDLPGRD